MNNTPVSSEQFTEGSPHNPDTMPLSAIGRKVLLSHGKQIEIASRLGVSVSYVSMVANGKRLPRKGKGRAVQVAIARALGMKLHEAFQELNQQHPSQAA